MILNYSVKNFYSIGKEGASVDFTVNGNAPKTDLYSTPSEDAGRVSLIEAVIGSNASGKTQLLKGLAFIHHMLTSSYYVHPNDPMLFKPHLGLKKCPSEITVRFTVKKRLFEYGLVFTEKRILKEEYREFSKTKTRLTGKLFASREWNEETNKYSFTDKELGISSRSEIRKNASMLSSAMQKETPSALAKLISDYWADSVIVHNLWMGGNREDGSDNLLRRTLRDLFDDDNKAIRDRVKDILKAYDLGFEDFHREVITLPNDETKSEHYINHRFTDSDFVVLIEEESSGTKRLISTLTNIVRALLVEEGGIAIIDEIDAYLHPDVVEALINLFVHPETNPHRAQILFSTHNHRLLESLDKQQITLTEKNKEGKTEAWRLDEMDVDSRDNYYTKYISGAYGARPRIGV